MAIVGGLDLHRKQVTFDVCGQALLRCSIAGDAEAGTWARADQMAGLSSSNAVANRNTRVASTASS